MFKNTHAFSSFPVDDTEKVKDFYSTTLGIDVSEAPEGLGLHFAGGGSFSIMQSTIISPRALRYSIFR